MFDDPFGPFDPLAYATFEETTRDKESDNWDEDFTDDDYDDD